MIAGLFFLISKQNPLNVAQPLRLGTDAAGVCVHYPFFPSAGNWQGVCPIADQNRYYVGHRWPMRTKLPGPTDSGEPVISTSSDIVSDI